MRSFAGPVCAALLLADAPALNAADSDTAAVSAAINKAGRQRMLIQRMAKAWVMIGLGVQPERGRTILDESLVRFEGQLTDLNSFAPSEDVRRALTQLERAWQAYRAALRTAPNRQHALAVYDHSEIAQEAAHRLTLAYEKTSGASAHRLVNIAGRQRMLSQRLAKFWLFQAWDVNVIAARMELNFAGAEFASGMRQLHGTAGTSPAIGRVVEQLDRDWIAYQGALAEKRDTATMRRSAPEVVELSERVLATAERLVALYESQAGAR
jgi:nitrate/nitrite-specific signal transduction histidine kinase